MRKLAIIATLALLAACSNTPKDVYTERQQQQQKRQEKLAENTVSRAPDWMSRLPTSSGAVYAAGTAVSADFGMAEHKAKLMAYSKICMAAGGRVSQSSRIFMQDLGDASVETSQIAIRSMCPSVDVTGVEIREVQHMAEGGRYRSYVLVALPTGDNNSLRQQRDRQQLLRGSQERSDRAFEEMNASDKNH